MSIRRSAESIRSADARTSATSPLTRRRFLGLAAGGAAAAGLGGLRVPFVFAADAVGTAAGGKADVRREAFGRTPDGAEVFLFTLTNGRGWRPG
jgi:hypothetical protein